MTAGDWRNVERLAGVLDAFTRCPPEARRGIASFLFHNHDRFADRSSESVAAVAVNPQPKGAP
jgi:hypothetical protein